MIRTPFFPTATPAQLPLSSGWARVRTATPLICFAVAAAAVLALAWYGAMNAPYWDAWTWFEWLRQYRAGEAGLGQILVRQHNEHPYGLPAVLFILTGEPWGYDLRVASMLTALVFCFNAWLIQALVREATNNVAAAVATVLLCLSLRSVENLTYGFQLGFPLTVLFGLVAIKAARSTTKGGVATMGLALAAGGFSSAAILAAFPAVLIMISSRRDKGRKANVYVAVGIAIAWVSWFMAGIAHSHQPSQDWEGRGFGLLILAGSPFTGDRTIGALLGLLVIAGFVAMARPAWRTRDPSRMTLAAMGVFSLGMIAITAMGRGAMGGINPSRYAIFGLPLAAVTIALACMHYRRLRYLFTTVVAIAYLTSALAAIDEATTTRTLDARLGAVLINNAIMSDSEIAVLNSGPPSVIRPLIAMMELNRFSSFRDPERYRLAPGPAVFRFTAEGASFINAANGMHTVIGRGHVSGASPCAECLARLDLRELSTPDPIAGKIATGDTRNAGFLFYDDSNRLLLPTVASIEGGGPLLTLATLSPKGTTRVEAYVFSPSADRPASFRTMTISTSSR